MSAGRTNVVSGGGGGGENTTPFFEIQKEETSHYLNSSGYSVVVAIYPISTYNEPCIFLPLTSMLNFAVPDAEITLPSGLVYYGIIIGNYQIVFTSEGGGSPILHIQIGGYEVLPDGWSARYFVYSGN